MPVLELFGQQIGLDAFEARDLRDDVEQDHEARSCRRPAAALLRVAVESSTPMRDDGEQRDQVAGVGGEHEQQAFGRRDDGAREASSIG